MSKACALALSKAWVFIIKSNRRNKVFQKIQKDENVTEVYFSCSVGADKHTIQWKLIRRPLIDSSCTRVCVKQDFTQSYETYYGRVSTMYVFTHVRRPDSACDFAEKVLKHIKAVRKYTIRDRSTQSVYLHSLVFTLTSTLSDCAPDYTRWRYRTSSRRAKANVSYVVTEEITCWFI